MKVKGDKVFFFFIIFFAVVPTRESIIWQVKSKQN